MKCTKLCFLWGCLLSEFGLLLAMGQVSSGTADQSAQITVQADKPGIPISPMLYGIFFEEVSRAGDGGFYSELIRNGNFRNGLMPDGFRLEGKDLITRVGLRHRADEVGNPLDGWSVSGNGQISVVSTKDECDQGGVAGRIVAKGAGDGIINSGYYGIPVKAGKDYQMLLICRNEQGNAGEAIVELVDPAGKAVGQTRVSLADAAWERRETNIKASADVVEAKLRVTFAKPATVLLRYVSLMPAERWHGLPIRADMAEKINAIQPSFLRFPGGGFVPNLSVDTGWNWKETIGPRERRPGRIGMWGYRSTDGLGCHEYLLLCEAMKMEPVPVINMGISCMAFKYEVEPMEKMGRLVQDALDLIEYANGPADSTWGILRAAAGHPAPFNIKFLSIGNESGGEPYDQRYPLFYSAIKKRYPGITLVSCQEYKNRAAPVDMFDHHFYFKPQWFIGNGGYYDHYSRSKKIFVSEFAAIDQNSQGNLISALGESVFMMGMERNSNVVAMSTYAPLFINTKHRSWPNSMFVFDNTRVYGTPSYHSFKMFSETRGDRVLPVKVSAPKEHRRIEVAGGVGIGTWATQIEAREVKVFAGEQPLAVVSNASDWSAWKKPVGQWKVSSEGHLTQSGTLPMTCAHFGEKDWNAYTYTLNVRKTGGNEGVRIYFGYQNSDNNLLLCLGGFGNRMAMIERRVDGKREEITPKVPFKIETNRWYQVKIDLTNERVRCLVDDAVLFDLPMSAVAREEENDQVFASASRTEDGRIFLRAVNVSAHPFQTAFHLEGIGALAPEGLLTCLSGNHPNAENNFQNPERISAQMRPITVSGQSLMYCMPPYSLSTFSLKRSGNGAPK